MTAFLPQRDKRKKRRENDLAARQAQYHYNYEYVSPLAMCDDVPFWDEFSVKWMIEIGERLLNVLSNLLELESDPHIREEHRKNHTMFKGIAYAGTFNLEGILKTLQTAVEMGSTITRPHTLEEYATLFRTIGLPPIHKDYRDDAVFADMRVAGPNPVMIHQIDRLDDRFPVTELDYQVALPGDSLEVAGQEGRLFLCDYSILEGLEKSDFPVEKFVYAPLALFALDKQTRKLAPVAIQCKQITAPDNPIFTPQDGNNWLIAKTIVGMADGNVHEPITHLGRTHLFMEAFVMATQRQLATQHPLGMLLRPHFEGTLHINDLAQKYLIAPKGGVHRLCNGSIETIRGAAVRGVQEYSFNDVLLPLALKARGVDDPAVLPHYPYRDDALLYWNAIRDWVEAYLSIWYKSDTDIREDTELQNWCRELVAQDGGRVVGFGENGAINSRQYLFDAVTLIVFTSSVQHAAVNFPQYDLMSYAAAMPLACYASAPTAKSGATEEDFLNILPPFEIAHLQCVLGYGLGSLYYTQLGQYDFCHFRDYRVILPLRHFKKRIKEIGKTIDERNQNRRPYEFLLPKGIPQSINI